MLKLRLFNQNSFLSLINSINSRLVILSLFCVLAFNMANAQVELISRTVSNTVHCNNHTEYGAWLNFDDIDNYYTISDASLVEYNDGTASFTGTITNNTITDISFHIDVTFSGRTFNTPQNSPKANSCGNNNTSDWYYYTSTWGTLTGQGVAEGALINLERNGPSFQLGTGANQTEGQSIFNASGWLKLSIVSQPNASSVVLNGNGGDFNINLSGAALQACNNVTNGGKIGPNEVAAGPFTPTKIISESHPTGGGSADIEYMWLKATNPFLPWNQWDVIGGANEKSYLPSDISETTYFLRCSRRLGCSYWAGESNVIAKIINGDGTTCNPGATVEDKSGNGSQD